MKAKQTRKVLTSILDNNLRDDYQTEFMDFLEANKMSNDGAILKKAKGCPSAKAGLHVNNQHRTDITDDRTDEADRRGGTDKSENRLWNVPANLPPCIDISDSRRWGVESEYQHGTDNRDGRCGTDNIGSRHWTANADHRHVTDITDSRSRTDQTESGCVTGGANDLNRTDTTDSCYWTDETVKTDHRHKSDASDCRREIDKHGLPQTDDHHPNDFTGEGTKSDLRSRSERDKLRGIRTKGGTVMKSGFPVAHVVCDGEIYELVSPSELKESVKIRLSQRSREEDSESEQLQLNTTRYSKSSQTLEQVTAAKNQDHEPEPEAMTFLSLDKHGRRIYKCNICLGIIAEKLQAERHSLSHSKCTCPLCKKEFASIQDFQGHVVSRHLFGKKKRRVKAGQYTCGVCYKVFKFFSLYKNHIVRHTASRRFVSADYS